MDILGYGAALLLVAATATAAPVAELEAMRACAAKVLGVDEPADLPYVEVVPPDVVRWMAARARLPRAHQVDGLYFRRTLVIVLSEAAGPESLRHEVAHYVQHVAGLTPSGRIRPGDRRRLEREARAVAAAWPECRPLYL